MIFFSLRDRIQADGANDLDVVEDLDRALHTVDGKAPLRNRRPQKDVLSDLKAFQNRAGLKPDGEAAPGGPTHRRIDAAIRDRNRQTTGQPDRMPKHCHIGRPADSKHRQ